MNKGRLRILLVDDEQLVLQALTRLLDKHEVVHASDHQGALGVMLQRLLDLVVADHNLGPGPNGADVLAAAAMLQPHSVRVLLTAAPPADVATLIGQKLIHFCIEKPFKRSIGAQLESIAQSHRKGRSCR